MTAATPVAAGAGAGAAAAAAAAGAAVAGTVASTATAQRIAGESGVMDAAARADAQQRGPVVPAAMLTVMAAWARDRRRWRKRGAWQLK